MTRRRMRLVRRCDEMSADGVLQGGERGIELRLGPLLDRGQVRCLKVSGPPAKNAPRVFCAATKAAIRAARCGAEVGVARCGEETFQGRCTTCSRSGRLFGPVHECGGRHRVTERLCREYLERLRRSARDPDGTLEDEVALRQSRRQGFCLGGVGHPEEGPSQRNDGHDDAHEHDRPMRRVPVPACVGRILVPSDGVGPGAHGDTYRRVRASS